MAKSLSFRKTKIVSTIGPASWEKEQLKELIHSGMNIARLNFSHGTFDQHQLTVERIREISTELEAPVGILQDLQGPKIRLSQMSNEWTLKKGDIVTVTGPGYKKEDKLVVDFENLHQYVSTGQSIFIDDGIIELEVQEANKQDLTCKVIHGGVARSRKGVNLPDAQLPISSMTEKDLLDLESGIALEFDFVALSFVRSAEDIIDLRKKLKKLGSQARVIAKIEKKEAIVNIDEIVEASDAIMIARGDLAVEIGQVHLPAVQKKIIHLCNKKGRPVITATQMLDSMQNNSRPTRAEITDVANAVLDGSDALMLSGETAFGKYPTRSVQTMHEIICEVEKQPSIYFKFKNRKQDQFTVPESIAISTVLCSKQLDAKTIVCMSTTGKTAQMISKYRPKAQLIAVTYKSEALNRLELCWGVQTLKINQYDNTEEAFAQIESLLLENKIVKPGDHVVLTLGLPVKQGQKTNSVRVFTVGDHKESKVKKSYKKPIRFFSDH